MDEKTGIISNDNSRSTNFIYFIVYGTDVFEEVAVVRYTKLIGNSFDMCFIYENYTTKQLYKFII